MPRHPKHTQNQKENLILFKYLVLILVLVFLFPIHLQAQEISNQFKPAWWCRGSHLQTIYGGLFRANPEIPLKRERFETPDGDFLNLSRLDGSPNTPVIVVLHGLGSSSEAPYIHSLLSKIHQAGWRAVAINARGSGKELNRLKEIHHGGKTNDLDSIINYLIETKHEKLIYLVGYSLGGNIILKWLGEKEAALPKEVKKAVAVSVPYDLAKAAQNLDHGFNQKVYTRLLLRGLKKQALEKEKQFPGIIDVEKVKNADTFQIFDREVTARLNGFQDENDYWKQSSSLHFLERIKTPVLLIHAANDPFLPVKNLPLEIIKQSPNLKLLLTSDGGHLGFISGSIPFRPNDWLERVILEYFKDQHPA